jgi:hypothetical protein
VLRRKPTELENALNWAAAWALGHKDRKLAEKQAFELLHQLVSDEAAVENSTLTLGSLQRLYLDSVPPSRRRRNAPVRRTPGGCWHDPLQSKDGQEGSGASGSGSPGRNRGVGGL